MRIKLLALRIYAPLIFFLILFFLPSISHATDFSSTNYNVKDPVIQVASSTEMSSASFRLTGSIGQMSIGTSTSVTFEVRSGFLYFPKVTLPVPTATAGDGSVSLSWTASLGFLGWTVSGYNVGYSAVSGGPYTYTASLGNVLSTTISSLSNGTLYYFIVRPEDAFANSLATSSEVTATPSAGATPSPTPTPTPSGGGGGIIIELLKQFVYPALPKPEIDKIRPPSHPYSKTDLNSDGIVDLRDLSIYLYLSSDPTSRLIDFNSDSIANISDLSVLFSDWSRGFLAFKPDYQIREPENGKEFGSGFAFVGEKQIENQGLGDEARMQESTYVTSLVNFIPWLVNSIYTIIRDFVIEILKFLRIL